MGSAFSSLEEPGQEAASQDAPSISGVRVAVVPQEVSGEVVPLGRGRHLRGIIITVEGAPAPGQGSPGGANERDEFQVEFAHDTQFFAGLSHDMSLGGILVATYRDVPIGSRVNLDFELPTGVFVQTRGEVRWIREESAMSRRALAIVFRDISPDSLHHISEYCRVYPPLFLDLES